MSQNMIDAQQHADDVLGQALRVTRRAYIFVPRVAAAAQRVACKFHMALGRALAHEIGHLVLPSYSHSRDGIMRATVDLSKWPQRFSRDQVDTIHRTVAADLAGVSDVEVKSAEPGRTRGIK